MVEPSAQFIQVPVELLQPRVTVNTNLNLGSKEIPCRSSQLMNHFQAINHIQQISSLFSFLVGVRARTDLHVRMGCQLVKKKGIYKFYKSL